MRKLGLVLAWTCLGCSVAPAPVHPPRALTAAAESATPLHWPAELPVYDHVVIVVEENKDYDQVLDGSQAPYIKELQKAGADLKNMYAEEHPSQGNYFWLFSGSNQGVQGDTILSSLLPPTVSNLGQQLIAANRSFIGYSEDLPQMGSTVRAKHYYARKHAPWISFSNLAPSTNLPFSDFPTDFTKLPTVSFVIPNLIHDMHGAFPHLPSVRAGNDWLHDHLDAYYRWAVSNNSLLILTSDENDHGPGGLTDPAAKNEADQNRIFTLFVGAHVKAGNFDTKVTHVNILRTLEAMYGIKPSGAQQTFARNAGIADDTLLTGVFEPVPAASGAGGK